MLQPEQHLGSYKLVAQIGAGGMGEVWKAEDTRLGRMVAIKVLPAAVASDAEAVSRLRREARTAAQLYHPNIATIHSIEEEGDLLFIVMELVDGEPLTRLIRGGQLAEADVCRIGRGVADALAEAHEHGIIHRDIKPDNIIVKGNRVKVLDFGIAKRFGVETTTPDDPTAFVTQQGMIIGTVHYMSPEQALGKSLDARTDLFSLGVVLYEAATGKLPFAGETMTETLMHIIRDEPRAATLVNPALSPGLNAIIARCLQKKREDRYATAAELSEALDVQLAVAKTAPMTQAKTPPLTQARTAIRPPSKTVVETPTVLTGPMAPPAGHRWKWIAAIGIVLAIAVGVALLSRRDVKHVVTAPPPAAAQRPAPSTATMTVTEVPPPALVEAPKDTPKTATTEAPKTEAVLAHVATSAPALAHTTPHPKPPANPQTDPAPAPQPRLPAESQAEPGALATQELYDSAMTQLIGGDWPQARKTLHRVIQADPHFAKAHFRMGEIALLNRNLDNARPELQRALDDAQRLDPREQQLARLGLAVVSGNRDEARSIARDLHEARPRDPDLEQIVRTFPGMFLGGRRKFGGKP